MEENIDNYWDQRWKNQQTGWDVGVISKPLREYFEQLKDKSISILIPGCGNAYEAEYLWSLGFANITVLDISESLCQHLKLKFGNRLHVECADFFNWEGKYDLIIEQTFFCAIPVNRRADYARKSAALLKDGGKLVGLLFDKDFDQQGPPFGGNEKEYRELFKTHFEIKTMEKCYNSILPRQGTELFIHLSKK